MAALPPPVPPIPLLARIVMAIVGRPYRWALEKYQPHLNWCFGIYPICETLRANTDNLPDGELISPASISVSESDRVSGGEAR